MAIKCMHRTEIKVVKVGLIAKTRPTLHRFNEVIPNGDPNNWTPVKDAQKL